VEGSAMGEESNGEASVFSVFRTQTVAPWVPILAMTATLTVSEVTKVKEMLCIKDDKLVVITSSPVQPQHKIYIILRPNSFYCSVNGDPGTK
jgi:hypothetical protein